MKRLTVFISFSFLSLLAQENNIVIGERVKMKSNVYQQERQILIHLPQSYTISREMYPVIYLLDGNDHFDHVCGIVDFLAREFLTPEMIVVGIPNIDRSMELTPKPEIKEEQFPQSGGADIFLKYLMEDIEPFLIKNYRTQRYKILIGHSFGGLFAIHTLLHQPDSFNAYMAISPSLWWGNQMEVKYLETFVKKNPTISKSLYMTLGSEGDQMIVPVDAFTQKLQKNTPKGLTWKYNFMPKETHSTIPHRSIYDGLEWMCSGWVYSPFSQGASFSGLKEHYKLLSDEFKTEIIAPEAIVNRLGYTLLQRGKSAESLEVFEDNVKKFPESANVYDSIADVYEALGRIDDALTSCEKAWLLGKKSNHVNQSYYKQHFERIKALKAKTPPDSKK